MIQTFKSFAKINLFLHVTSKRNDGYHNLYSMMTQIDLCDDIHIEFSQDTISVHCEHPDVPEDESNLACKAAALFFDSLKTDFKSEKNFNKTKKGIYIEIIKRIPPGGGLGGGSSNAATILTALNNYYKNPFSQKKLMAMGLKLGADIPFFIFNSPAIARGVGEKLEKLPSIKTFYLVLCDPGVQASTAKVYKNIDFRLTAEPKYNINTGLNILFKKKDFDLRDILHNDLEEPACRLYPEIKKTKQEMEFLLKRKVFMSGSGSSLFALFTSHENADKGYKKLVKEWNKKVFLSSFKQNL